MKKYGPIFRMLSLITQIGITMLTSIFFCMFLGLWIDRKFSTFFSFFNFRYPRRNESGILSDRTYRS